MVYIPLLYVSYHCIEILLLQTILSSYSVSVKIAEDGLNFYFSFSFLFSFPFSIYFLFLELGLRLSDKDHAVTYRSHQMTQSQVTERKEGRRRF